MRHEPTFHNVDVDPGEPVENWPLEAIRTAVDRGGLADRRRLASAVRADPWGGSLVPSTPPG